MNKIIIISINDKLFKLPKKIHQHTLFISESGLYSLVLKSRMINAKKWIKHAIYYKSMYYFYKKSYADLQDIANYF